MTRTRFHHLTVCALCVGMCFLIARNYRIIEWQYWLFLALAIYAEQPLINECKPLVARLWPKRKSRNPYELVHPIAKQGNLL